MNVGTKRVITLKLGDNWTNLTRKYHMHIFQELFTNYNEKYYSNNKNIAVLMLTCSINLNIIMIPV